MTRPSIKRLPEAARQMVEHVFVDALHPIFLTAGLVAAVAVILAIALPDQELRGPAGPRTAPGNLEDEDDETAAAEMESQAATMI